MAGEIDQEDAEAIGQAPGKLVELAAVASPAVDTNQGKRAGADFGMVERQHGVASLRIQEAGGLVKYCPTSQMVSMRTVTSRRRYIQARALGMVASWEAPKAPRSAPVESQAVTVQSISPRNP